MTVLVVGALHLDVVVRAPHLPRLDETVTGDSVAYVFGGKGGNQAAAVARLGGVAHFAGRAGRDGFGDMLRHELAARDVDAQQVQDDPGPSGMSTAIVDAQGDYGAVIVSAANLNIDAKQIDIPKGTSLVLLQNEIPEAVNLAIARKAHAAGAVVWLNAAPARALPPELVARVDLAILNRVEADFYAGLLTETKTLVTLGAEGVRYEGRQWPAHAVKVLSTHGAGDMFIGALAARVTNGARITEAIPFAQAAAAWHISTRPDARAAMSTDALVTLLAAQSSP